MPPWTHLQSLSREIQLPKGTECQSRHKKEHTMNINVTDSNKESKQTVTNHEELYDKTDKKFKEKDQNNWLW